jgi:hypothetical protein
MNTTTRCESMSRRGRCRRMTKDPSKKCHQHRNSQMDDQRQQDLQQDLEQDQMEEYNETQLSSQVPRPIVIDLSEETIIESEIPFTEQVFPVVSQIRVQCEGTTRSGVQCAKLTSNTNKRCHLHQVDSLIQPVSDPIAPCTIAPRTLAPRTVAPRTLVLRPRRTTTQVRFDEMAENMERLHNQVRQIEETFARTRLQELTSESSHKDARPKRTKEDSKKSSGKTEDCCVCYDPVPEEEFLECEHSVCKNCIGQLRDTRCPMCRADIKSKNISDKEKKKMIRRRQEDHRNRNNELFQNYMQSQNQMASVYSSFVPQILPLENIQSFVAHITL